MPVPLFWIWAFGSVLILILDLGMFIETIWRTRAPLGTALQDDAWFLAVGLGFALTWPIVLAGCGAGYGLYCLARPGRRRQRG